MRRTIESPPAGTDLRDVAAKTSYVGSPEHKNAPSFAGDPRPRADATICDPIFHQRQSEINQWLRQAIESGHVGAHWEGSTPGFPRYVWYRDGDDVYEARLVNCEQGQYKGYQLGEGESPQGLP